MNKYAHELIFISQIKRDGSGVEEVSKNYIDLMLIEKEIFYLQTLSLTEKTFIAFNFNAFVVKLK